jgi:DNA-binding NtrC family response regulator
MPTHGRVLLAHPKDDLRTRLAAAFRARGWSPDAAANPHHCLALLGERDYQALLVGRQFGDWSGAELLEQARRSRPQLVIIMVSDEGSPQEGVRLARLGLDEYVPENADPDGLVELAGRRRHQDGEALSARGTTLIGHSRAMRQVAETVRLIATRRSTVLITGPTGTGKELVARLIHALSPRAGREMVTVNCGAIPEHLLEAEFFGHVKGAFTGAVASRIGRLEQAQGSTLFLDEIGDMPRELQAKVLRAVQEREFQRVGSSQTVQVDVRVVAATNTDLAEKVRRGEFREDLYYRLNVVPIGMPPLAERLEDVPALAEHFVHKICRAEDLPRKRVSAAALERLLAYHWPGNVRQLENAVEKAVVLSGDRQELYPSDFTLPSIERRPPASAAASFELPPGGLDLDALLSGIELNLLRQALERAGGNKNRAAQILGLKRTTLSAKLKKAAG